MSLFDEGGGQAVATAQTTPEGDRKYKLAMRAVVDGQRALGDKRVELAMKQGGRRVYHAKDDIHNLRLIDRGRADWRRLTELEAEDKAASRDRLIEGEALSHQRAVNRERRDEAYQVGSAADAQERAERQAEILRLSVSVQTALGLLDPACLAGHAVAFKVANSLREKIRALRKPAKSFDLQRTDADLLAFIKRDEENLRKAEQHLESLLDGAIPMRTEKKGWATGGGGMFIEGGEQRVDGRRKKVILQERKQQVKQAEATLAKARERLADVQEAERKLIAAEHGQLSPLDLLVDENLRWSEI